MPVFNTIIRHSKKVKDSTFYHKTPIAYCVRSGAAQGYKNFILEYMNKPHMAAEQKERDNMGFNIMDIMNGATRAAVEGVDNYEAITLNLDEIKVTKHNRYSMDDLEELATSILMDGLQEPLIIGRVNGEYLLSGGHRRREALVILQNEGHTEITQNIPCRFKDMTETQFRLSLLIGNTFNRKMTDYDLMNQAADWKEVLTQARKEKLLVLEEGKRVRDYVAAVLGEKPTKIAQLEAINNNATEEVKEQFEKGNMKITSAYETSRLSEDAQKEVAAAVEAGADIKSEEIKQMSEEKKKKRKTAEDIAKEQNVSDTDTSEEEKANAKKLHAVKMLEKYYIYLSEEETGILERMLEDCKRRKREYALEEDKTGMGKIILFPTHPDYCKRCIYSRNNGTCASEKYNENQYKVNCVWHYCKYRKEKAEYET